MALVDNVWYINFGNGTSTGYYGVTAWAALTTKVTGNLVRQLVAPATNSERVFVAIASTAGTGATGAAEPTWVITRGGKTTDSTVTWQEATGIAALNGDLTNTPNWTTVKNTVVTVGQVIKNNAATLVLIASTGGTAGNGAEPTWAAFTNAGATTADNTVTWTTLGASFAAWAAPHARLVNAFTATWGQASNNFYVGDNHAETQATSMTLNGPGAIATPIFVYDVDHTVAPPGSGNLKTTATITTTGTSNIQIGSSNGAVAYYNGIQFNGATGAGNASLSICSANNTEHFVFENCAMFSGSTGNNFQIGATAVSSRVWFINTTASFPAVGNFINMTASDFVWKNTPSAITGSNLPTTLFSQASAKPAKMTCIGVDFSALGSGKTVNGANSNGGIFATFIDCGLGASVTFAATPANPGQGVDLIRTDSTGTNYRVERYRYEGTQTVETTIVRTGGASVYGTPISWKILTTANSNFAAVPFVSVPIQVSNLVISPTAVTVTVYGIWGSASLPNNDDIWIEAEYLGSTLTPQASFINDTKANGLATGSPLASDSSTWGGSVGSNTKFKMTVTLTAAQTGQITVRVYCAKATTTFYVDPQPVLS